VTGNVALFCVVNAMPRITILLVMLLAAGCGTKNYSVANPVLGPAPPRIRDAQARQSQLARATENSTKTDDEGGLKTVSAEEVKTVNSAQELPLEMTDVIARVNGKPIFAGDILDQYSSKLNQFRRQMEAGVEKGVISQDKMLAKLRETQEMLVKRDLDHHVEQILMADAVRSKLKKYQLDDINHQMADYFEKEYVANLRKKFEVDTTVALEGVLQSQGMSLETMRKLFMDQQLASQYVRTKMGEDPKPSRAELVELYNSQLEKYTRPTQVKWQQLQINVSGTGKAAAAEKMEQAQAALKTGTSFDDVVKKYSDGPLKENGGHWDWTQPESVANEEIRGVLKKLKSGETSSVLTTGSSLQIVKVTARRESGHQPLEEVQEDLRQQIIGEFRERRAEIVVKEIREKAIIETIFDQDPLSEDKPKIQ